MCNITNDYMELLKIAGSMIKRFEKGDFISASDVVHNGYIKLIEEGKEYEKGVFCKTILYGQVREAYRKTLSLSHPLNLDGLVYAKYSKTKVCCNCKEELSTAAFSLYYNAVYEGWYLSSQCKVCGAEKGKEWDKTNPDKRAAIVNRQLEKRKENRKREKHELTDAYMIKRLLKNYRLEWIKEHPEIIDKERRILRRKMINKAKSS